MLEKIIIAVLATIALIIIRRVLKLLSELLQIKKAEKELAGNQSAAAAYDLAIAVLDSIAETTVSRIEATQAAAVRKAVKSGEKPFTELTKCSEEAYQDILAQLSPYMMASLETCVGNTEKLIRNKIEEVLPKVKSEYKSLEDMEESAIPWNIDIKESQ